MYWYMDAVVLVAWSIDSIVQTVRIRVWLAVFLLLECQEVICCHAFDYMRGTRYLDVFDDGCDG